MLILQRILPLLSSLVVLIMLFFFFGTVWGVRFAPFILMVAAVSIWLMLRTEGSGGAIVNAILLISVFLGSMMSFSLLIEQEIVKNLLNILVVGGMYIFFEQLYIFWHRPSQYRAYALEYTSSVLNILSAFFLFSAAFGYFIFIHASILVLMIVVMVAAFGLGWLMMWINKIEWQRSRLYIFAIGLIIGEGFWVLHFLPVSFMVLGLVLTTMIYLLLNLSRWQLSSSLDRRILQRYIIISSVVLLITFGTATWT